MTKFSCSKLCSMKKNIPHINIIKSATLAIIVNFDDGDKFELHVKEFYLHLDKTLLFYLIPILFVYFINGALNSIHFICLFNIDNGALNSGNKYIYYIFYSVWWKS